MKEKQNGSRSESEQLEKLWTRKMAVEGFKKIYRVSLEGAQTEILDGNGDVVEVKYNPSAANAARSALEALNRLLGYGATAEEDDGGEIVVILGEAEEYSE